MFVYDLSGNPIHALKGHTVSDAASELCSMFPLDADSRFMAGLLQDAVYCLAYADDGSRFASGGADKTVIIWSSAGQGLLKFTHSSPIQALSYNPVTQQLASASETDFGLWSPEVRSVPKTALTSRALCVAWSTDGQYLAIGCEDGSVLIKDKAGKDHANIQKGSPVWSVAFSPKPLDKLKTLVVASWDGTLSYYKVVSRFLSLHVHIRSVRWMSNSLARLQTDGEPHGLKDVVLGFKPCTVEFSSNGSNLVVGGTSKKLELYTATGIFVSSLATKRSWIWAVSIRPGASNGLFHVACGTEDGSVCYESVSISTVHGLYKV